MEGQKVLSMGVEVLWAMSWLWAMKVLWVS